MNKRKTDVCCPDCGAQVWVREYRPGSWAASCAEPAHDECRNNMQGFGSDEEQALDELVRNCERYGFVRVLEKKLKAMVERVAS